LKKNKKEEEQLEKTIIIIMSVDRYAYERSGRYEREYGLERGNL